MSNKNVLMIDNYDSFTYNLYEYLCQGGANVTVYRNDKITIEEIEALNPDNIVISPGPGHPLTDAGISNEVIRHFAGKLPILGVCMGLECIFAQYGGDVAYAGEIVHGKTSVITHDSKGVFLDVPQGVAVTRYHSLAGSIPSLPEDLEVTAKTDAGVIMGVRHKKFTVEGVQFHPESILTESGHLMCENFLKINGGTWDEHYKSVKNVRRRSFTSFNDEKKQPQSILDEIYEKRKEDVAKQQLIPGCSFEDLNKTYNLGIAPPLIDFYQRLKSEKTPILSEIKRASPSKGPIDLQANAGEQALVYGRSGAAAISVLTEPTWFKGSIDDMRIARLVVDKLNNRPAILRKEFVFEEYQILEARLNGADTVLLIVKMLDKALLARLYDYSKKLGMEPLVEVNSAKEMEIANELGAKVIGVNNRDLHSFKVDLNTTSSLVDLVPKDVILLALSGISSVEDIRKYKKQNVGGFLIGEALMRAANTEKFIKELIEA